MATAALCAPAHAQTPSQFIFGTHAVRVVMIAGEPWFVCTDVAAALGYRDAANAARNLSAHQRGTHNLSTSSGEQGVTIINESGLYRLVLRSRKPEAVAFSDWVTGEVLPSIRKTGTYPTPEAAARVGVAYALAADVAREASFAVFESLLRDDALGRSGRQVWAASLSRDDNNRPRVHVRRFKDDELTVSASRIAHELRHGELSAHFSDEALSDTAAACLEALTRRLRPSRASREPLEVGDR